MNNEQIKREILRYLGDDNYRYAVLLDGEWGCGKTYFVLNEVKEAVERYEKEHAGRTLRYISLYGVKTVEAVEEKVIWSIIDEKFYAGYNKLAHIEENYGAKRESLERKGKSLYGITQKFVGTVMQKLDLPFKTYEYVADLMELNQNIFVFDDLERCNCHINDVLGYINGLVEHEGVKIILVADEKAIGKLEEQENKELQYLIAANKAVKIPKEKSFLNYARNDEAEIELELAELERRRKKIFSDDEYDAQYLKIREKLVGITLQFEPDFASVMHQLIHQSEKPTELKDALNLHTNYFMGIMQQNKHQNLRTFQFFLSKIDFLYEELQSTGIDSKYYKQLLDFLIENCFLLCVEFKGNIKEPEDDFAKIRFQNKRRLTSVDSYVRSSIFNGEEFKTELEQYVYAELSQHLLPNDPYSLLYNEYYMHTQEWVENTIQAMLEKLKQDAYAINTYPNLILVLVLLKQHGFSEDYIKQAMNYMIQNVEKQDVHEHRLDDHVPAQDGNVIRECKEYIEKVNKAIYTLQEEQWSQSMRDILEKNEDWASQLSSYIDSIKGSMPYESLIFDRVDADIWVQKILASDACNINSFRRFLNQIYPSNVIKRNVKKDMLVLKEIGEKVQQHEETDLIKKMQLSWLTEQIGEICKRNGGVCKNVK